MASYLPAKRKMLTLNKKVKVLRLNEQGDKAWSIAASVGVGPTQVYSIIKNRDLVMSEWSSGHTNSNCKQLMARKLQYPLLN